MAASHMSRKEIAKMDDMNKRGKTPQEILAKLQAARNSKGETGPSKDGVYRFLSGHTYKRGAKENRGRRARLPPRLVQIANAERRKLIQKASNDHLVVWADIHKATKNALRDRGLLRGRVRMPSVDWLARLVRTHTQVRARPGKRRIARTRDHERQRYEQAQRWQRYPKTWWEKDIHAYIDNKKFVLARSAKDKKLLRATRVHHHLRTPAEGSQRGFVLPKKNRMLLGVPSIDVTAAVAHDQIIMWHVSWGQWNGEKAAEMYAKLGEALRKKWGRKRVFRVVEDGDTKGFQSSKGKEAKKFQKIESWMLPPRSPGWMPLDFCLWDEIEGRLLHKEVKADETQRTFEARLRRTALRLPQQLMKSCLGKMKENIDSIVASAGKHTMAMLD